MTSSEVMVKMRTFYLKRGLKYETQQEKQMLEKLEAKKVIIRLFSAFSGSDYLIIILSTVREKVGDMRDFSLKSCYRC